ncbi:amino acid permease [Luteococcus sp. OSA5]|uniref:amino acid permease n=1 Tax=Luteococcus sp. OSA5 TaxID=3401630 RepID=UPI003B438BCA
MRQKDSPYTGPVSQDRADHGYEKHLKPRHIRMIAIGGSIGTGLFLGAGGRLAAGGPSLAIVYALCGLFAFLMVRALGELTIHRPSSGAFVSYAREFMGEKGAYVTGWLFFLDWCTTVMADITAVALYMHFWSIFSPIPQWIIALIALAIVFAMNMLSVKFFGEFEFWFAMIKVAAIVGFMLIAVVFIATGHQVAGHTPGPQLITDNGGLFPKGLAPMVTLALGVVFAFGGTEMVGVAAGEAKDAEKIMPGAVNSMMWRIALFYVGSVVLFTMLMPWHAYSRDESPFVTFFNAIGVQNAGTIMNLVVLTAALSSLNAGLYATGRTLRSMAVAGSAPAYAARLNRNAVPYGGIVITSALGLIGVMINYIWPSQAFDIVMNLAGIGIAGTWISIMVSHWIFVHRAKQGLYERPKYRLFWAPWTNLATIVFLVGVIVMMWFADEIGKPTITLFGVVALIMVIGWYAVRDKIDGTVLESSFLDTSTPTTEDKDA